MDGERFDRLAKVVGHAANRRQLLRALVGAAASSSVVTSFERAIAAPRSSSVHLPFADGQTWFYVGGPHVNLDTDVRCAIDLAPVDAQACPNKGHSQYWATAAADGKVTKFASDLLEIQHEDGSYTGYAHLANRRVSSVGSKIRQGDRLGQPACIGDSQGWHVHFYFRDQNGAYVPADGKIVSGWTIHETPGNYNGTLIAPDGSVRTADVVHCSTSNCSPRNDVTSPAPNPAPPSLVGVPTVSTAVNKTTISITTDQPTTAVLQYGDNSRYGKQVNSNALSTSHSFDITNLSANKTYHYKITLTNGYGLAYTSRDLTFKTPGLPKIIGVPSATNLTADAARVSAVIVWKTDQPTSSVVSYGATTAYGSVAKSVERTTSHSITLSSLKPRAKYHFSVTGVNENGIVSPSADRTFTEKACASPSIACGDTCVDKQTDDANCGTCGHSCSQLDGERCCSGRCVTIDSDVNNCGACGKKCNEDEICSAGDCCLKGSVSCNGSCVDPAGFVSDNNNCGECGRHCASGTHCVNSDCAATCADGETSCAGKCTDITSDTNNCGGCGVSCDVGKLCVSSSCQSALGTLVVKTVDATSGSAIAGAWIAIDDNGKTGAWDLYDGTQIGDPTIPVDGIPDGKVTFTNLAAGDYRVVFMGVVDPSSSIEPYTGIHLSPQYVDTQVFRWVSVQAGGTSEITIPLTGPTATINATWKDGCGNLITPEDAAAYQLSLVVGPPSFTTWWSGGSYSYGYFRGSFCTEPGIISAVFGAGTLTLSPARDSYIWPNSAGNSQLVDTQLGQTTDVTAVFNIPCLAPASNASITAPSCAGSLTFCEESGGCVDLNLDPSNCGQCGSACPPDQSCAGGSCVPVVSSATPVA